MRISRLAWACLFASTACGSSDPVGSDPTGNGGDDDSAFVKPDAGPDSGSSTKTDAGKDGGARDTGVVSTGDSSFQGCADTRVDAEKKPGKVNVVWVIDTSGSMDQEAAQVQANMNRFAQQIVDAGLQDYRVVVISTNKFVNVPDPLGSDATHFLHIEQEVGSNAPLQQLIGRFGDYQKFLIADAVTHFIAVTDDESRMSGADFVTQMKGKLGSDNFHLNAIASPPGESSTIDLFGVPVTVGACTGPYGSGSGAGQAYWDAAMATGGITFSICTGDWGELFDQLAANISESASVPCSLELPADPSSATTSLDYDKVNVVLGSDALTRVADEGACGTKAGWYYDNPTTPTGIQLCPTSCDAATNGGSLQVALGCTTVVQ